MLDAWRCCCLQGSRIQKLPETIAADRALQMEWRKAAASDATIAADRALQMEWRKAAASDATEYTATVVARLQDQLTYGAGFVISSFRPFLGPTMPQGT
jgi:hypothetical protein